MQYKHDYSNDLFFKVRLNKGVYEISDTAIRLPYNTKNISGVWNMSLEELSTKGMYIQEKVGHDIPPEPNEKQIGPVNVFDPVRNVVVSTWSNIPKTQAEIDEENTEREFNILENAKGFGQGVIGQLFFNTLNDIRVLQGNPKYTKKQFLNIIINLKRSEWDNEK